MTTKTKFLDVFTNETAHRVFNVGDICKFSFCLLMKLIIVLIKTQEYRQVGLNYDFYILSVVALIIVDMLIGGERETS